MNDDATREMPVLNIADVADMPTQTLPVHEPAHESTRKPANTSRCMQKLRLQSLRIRNRHIPNRRAPSNRSTHPNRCISAKSTATW